jgi:hypothetical protein
MIEVILFSHDERVADAEALSPEAALLAARTMWDDHCKAFPYQGVHRALRIYFMVDGVLVRMVEGNRP